MAEVTGVAMGVVSIAMAFKGAVDTYLFIGSFFDENNRGCSYAALRYHIEKTRLRLWGDQCQVENPSNCTLRDRPVYIQEVVVKILAQVKNLNADVQTLADKQNVLPSEVLPNKDLGKSMDPNSDGVAEMGSRMKLARPRSVLSWVIKDRSDFEEKVERIHKLITDLFEITLQQREIQNLNDGLPSRAIAPLNREDLLEALARDRTMIHQPLGLAALAKLSQSRISVGTGSASCITSQELTIVNTSSNTGILKRSDGSYLVVRVEWNIVKSGSHTQRYIDRIKALGYVLEQVSESALRLPPCYGVFDDLSYEANMANEGEKRLGYIFGLPRTDSTLNNLARHSYDEDLNSYPPITLRELIKNQNKGSIPLLEDRFQLAYTLACAFSRFHVAGWLHKGFHTGSIVFFQNKGGKGMVDVTEPFITGFQYSRPQEESSLSQSPLQNKTLEHYYHPDADRGFTKRLDLYSLGVVLCEIGCWSLVPSSSKNKTRAEWRKRMLDTVRTELGWRMGSKYQGVVRTLLECELPSDDLGSEYFAMQFLEKVMKPLCYCNA
ncbi:hypothetical protein GL218_04342 [Daldinia childiae]|uniref:uncharacterized protein n=1 Tax=Daldinia childiae TaxID=326645 RepID=UPI0014452EB3|nr:uncharacterized protein GL218_04342 [Daldinia childiae]KAF3059576.1 hypothetical protein GL218_04342 [Daldinia childiae]